VLIILLIEQANNSETCFPNKIKINKNSACNVFLFNIYLYIIYNILLSLLGINNF